MAIESIQDHKSNVYTDVWSFGVTMWEIFSLGNQPYPTRTPEDVSDLYSRMKNKFWKKVRNFLEAGNRLDRPQYASRQLYQIMRDCWKAQPEQRPRFRDLADDLEKELDTLDREKKLDMSANGDDSKLLVFFSEFFWFIVSLPFVKWNGSLFRIIARKRRKIIEQWDYF